MLNKILNKLLLKDLSYLGKSDFKTREIEETELVTRIIKNRELIDNSEWNK